MSRYNRQSFLGANSDELIASATVGIVGLGGGGSHIVQQLAHVGIGGLICVDPDIVEDTNLNRLIGGTLDDATDERPKAEIAERMVLGLVTAPRFRGIPEKWQDATEALAECDIIVGGVDSYRDRSELEAFCRRLMIPYIDMGMDVHDLGDQFTLGGQVILSSPGCPCLWCLGVITPAALEIEAKKYGDAGGKPQVVWPNGVLASLAVGLVVQLLTPWMKDPVDSAYLEYDGNRHQVSTSNRCLAVKGAPCSHYPADQVGDPLFDIRRIDRSVPVDPGVCDDGQVTGTAVARGWWKRLLRFLGL